MPAPISLFSVNALLILSTSDDASPRVLVKYYCPPHLSTTTTPSSTTSPGANPYPTLKEQKAFEKGLLEKTAKQTSDVILYDNRIVVFKTEGDVMLYVVGSADENEILLYSALLALRDSLNILLKYVWNQGLLRPTPPLHILFSSHLTSTMTAARIASQLTNQLTNVCRNSTDKRTIIENYDLVSLATDEIIDDGIILETDPVLISSRVSRPPAQDIASVKNIDLSEQGLLNAWEFGKMKLAERMRQM